MSKNLNADVAKPPQRLCNEIQLFDLCSLGSCGQRQGEFCSNAELLSRFEQIADEELSCPSEQYLGGEIDESEDYEEFGYAADVSGDYCDEDDMEE